MSDAEQLSNAGWSSVFDQHVNQLCPEMLLAAFILLSFSNVLSDSDSTQKLSKNWRNGPGNFGQSAICWIDREFSEEVLPRQRILMYRCPDKYFRVGNNCYHLSNDKVSWREAIFSCEDLKGRLAVLDTKLEDQKLRKYLNRHKPDRNERWIAGSYDANNNVWRWAYSGEPFKYQAFSRQRRRGNAWKCTVMDHYLLYRWNSRSCLQKKKYICEHPIETIKSKKSINSVQKSTQRDLRILNTRKETRRKPKKKKQRTSNNLNDVSITN